MVKCSIIIPCYNEGEKLYKTVESLYRDNVIDDSIEIIIGNDGSNDGWVEKTYKDFPSIIINGHGQPYGTAVGKCLGYEASSGDTLLFMDGHTITPNGHLSKLIDRCLKYGVVSPCLCNIDEKTWKPTFRNCSHGVWWNIDKDFKKSWLKIGQMKRVEDGVYRDYGVHGGYCIIRRDIYNDVGGWDRNNLVFGIDYGMALKCWCFGYDIFHCRDITVGHLFKKNFNNSPAWWQIYYNRLRILNQLGSPEEIERFSNWPIQSAKEKAQEHINNTLQSLSLYQKKIKRSLSDYIDAVNISVGKPPIKVSPAIVPIKIAGDPPSYRTTFVTTLTNDFVAGAYALINSLNKNGGIDYKMVVVEYDKISSYNTCLLKNLHKDIEFINYRELGEHFEPQSQYKRLQHNFKKPLIWNLKYSHPLIYVDCDIICLSNIEGLRGWGELTVAQQYRNSDFFNAGLFGFQPSTETFNIIQRMAKKTRIVRLGDQIIMHNVFRKSKKGPLSNRLKIVGYSWNVFSQNFPQYNGKIRPKFLHFNHKEKPWSHGPHTKNSVQAWEEWKKYGGNVEKGCNDC